MLHVRFLASKCVADTLTLNSVNELRMEAGHVHGRLIHLSSVLTSAKRAGHSVSNGAAMIASTRGMGRKVDRQLAELERELTALSSAVESNLNKPGRYGDGAATGLPMLELLACVQTVLELAETILERRRMGQKSST